MNAQSHRNHLELVARIDPGGNPNNLVNQKQQCDQDSVMTLVVGGSLKLATPRGLKSQWGLIHFGVSKRIVKERIKSNSAEG